MPRDTEIPVYLTEAQIDELLNLTALADLENEDYRAAVAKLNEAKAHVALMVSIATTPI